MPEIVTAILCGRPQRIREHEWDFIPLSEVTGPGLPFTATGLYLLLCIKWARQDYGKDHPIRIRIVEASGRSLGEIEHLAMVGDSAAPFTESSEALPLNMVGFASQGEHTLQVAVGQAPAFNVPFCMTVKAQG